MHSPRAAVASPSPPTGRSKRKCTPCRSHLLLQRRVPCSFLGHGHTSLAHGRRPPALRTRTGSGRLRRTDMRRTDTHAGVSMGPDFVHARGYGQAPMVEEELLYATACRAANDNDYSQRHRCTAARTRGSHVRRDGTLRVRVQYSAGELDSSKTIIFGGTA
jgi:hypothetical protein